MFSWKSRKPPPKRVRTRGRELKGTDSVSDCSGGTVDVNGGRYEGDNGGHDWAGPSLPAAPLAQSLGTAPVHVSKLCSRITWWVGPGSAAPTAGWEASQISVSQDQGDKPPGRPPPAAGSPPNTQRSHGRPATCGETATQKKALKSGTDEGDGTSSRSTGGTQAGCKVTPSPV